MSHELATTTSSRHAPFALRRPIAPLLAIKRVEIAVALGGRCQPVQGVGDQAFANKFADDALLDGFGDDPSGQQPQYLERFACDPLYRRLPFSMSDRRRRSSRAVRRRNAQASGAWTIGSSEEGVRRVSFARAVALPAKAHLAPGGKVRRITLLRPFGQRCGRERRTGTWAIVRGAFRKRRDQQHHCDRCG